MLPKQQNQGQARAELCQAQNKLTIVLVTIQLQLSRYCRVKTFDTFNITLDSHGSVFQELLTAYEANLKRARVGGLTVIIRLISVELN